MFHTVLVPLDGSSLAEAALPHSMILAKTFGTDVKLLRVLETRSRGGAASLDIIDRRFGQAEAAAYLDAVAAEMKAHGIGVTTAILEGKPANQILEAVRSDERIDLLVLTSHGIGGPSEFALSGTAHKVAANAGTSVMVIPAREGRSTRTEAAAYGRVLVAFQGSRGDDVAASLGAKLAQVWNGELILAHVVYTPQVIETGPHARRCRRLAENLMRTSRLAAIDMLNATADRFRNTEFEIRTVIETSSHVGRSLAMIGDREDADLVILSAHGIGADTTWLYGSTTSQLIGEVSRPILIAQDAPRLPFDSRVSAPAWVRERFQPLTW